MDLLSRILNVALAFDQLIYTLITLGEGSPIESCSSAAWRMKLEGKKSGVFVTVIDLIFSPLEKNHCESAFKNVSSRKYVPEQYKNDSTSR